jgi:predicted negative regulator of RcsB-dependent stress response
MRLLFRETTLEKAYIFYRQNKNDECLAELSKANGEDPAVLELKAQLFYRLNRFQEAYDIYRYVFPYKLNEYID